jgi:hypothetical protein
MYNSKLCGCKPAVDIRTALEPEYAYISQEDEQCLKMQLVTIQKSATEDLNTFINRFDKLDAETANAALGSQHQFDDIDINSLFLQALELAQIPYEDWPALIVHVGNDYMTYQPRQLYAEACAHYSIQILPQKQTAVLLMKRLITLPVRSGVRGHEGVRGHGHGHT